MFRNVVALYRAFGCPAIEAGVIRYEGATTPEIIAAVDACRALEPAYGKVEHSSIEAGHIEFDFRLPSNEAGRFFDSVEELIRLNSSINRGVFPNNIFIVNENWSDVDGTDLEKIKEIKRVCRLVKLLADLAVGVDKESNPDCYNLFFALPPDGARLPRTFLLSTLIEPDVLQYEIHHLNLLEEILNKKNENKAHLTERKLMFRLAVADIVERFEHEANVFTAIVREWKSVLSLYRTNLQTYVYGFSFEKVRREVAQAEIDYGSKLSSVLGDIAGKLLALPLSLAALIALDKAESGLEQFIIFLGMVLVSSVLLAILHNQQLQVDRLLHSFNVVFDEFKSKIATYPQKLQKLLNITINQVDRQGLALTRTFRFLQFLSFIPALGASTILLTKHWGEVSLFLICVLRVIFSDSGVDPIFLSP